MNDFFDTHGKWVNALWNFRQYLMSVTYYIDRKNLGGGE